MIGFGNTSHHYHHHFTFTEVRRLYWARSVAALAGGLVSIFIPLYFLSLGYKFSAVIFYFVLYAASNLVLGLPCMKLMTKIGANHSMALSNILQIFFFTMLITLPDMHWPLPFLAFFAAIINELYWPAFHSNFSKAKMPGKSGRQVSIVTAITSIVGAASPAIGGIIATLFGIEYTYIIAIVLFVIAVIPLLSAKEVVGETNLSLKQIDPSLIKSMVLANGGHSFIQAVEDVVWPIFIFLIVASYASVGILVSLLVVGSVLTAIYVGRREELKGARHYLKEGSTALAATNILRTFASTAGHVFGLNLLGGVSTQLSVTPYMTEFYETADSPSRLAYVLIMEYAWFIGWFVFFGTLFVLSLFFSPNTVLITGMILAVPGSILMRKIR